MEKSKSQVAYEMRIHIYLMAADQFFKTRGRFLPEFKDEGANVDGPGSKLCRELSLTVIDTWNRNIPIIRVIYRQVDENENLDFILSKIENRLLREVFGRALGKFSDDLTTSGIFSGIKVE